MTVYYFAFDKNQTLLQQEPTKDEVPTKEVLVGKHKETNQTAFLAQGYNEKEALIEVIYFILDESNKNHFDFNPDIIYDDFVQTTKEKYPEFTI